MGKTNEWVEIYDTTLRDGAQGEGLAYTVEDKLKIARALDEIGVTYIEGGWPGANPKDVEFFERAKSVSLNKAQFAAFGSTRRANGFASDDSIVQGLLAAQTPIVTIFGKSWDFHVDIALKTTLEENLRMIADTISHLKACGRRVFYDAEHFFDWLPGQRRIRARHAAIRRAGWRGDDHPLRHQWRRAARTHCRGRRAGETAPAQRAHRHSLPQRQRTGRRQLARRRRSRCDARPRRDERLRRTLAATPTSVGDPQSRIEDESPLPARSASSGC
jgi:hypothetical protein